MGNSTLWPHGFNGREFVGLSKAALKVISAWPHVRRWVVKDPIGDKRLHITWHYINWDMTELAMLADVHDLVAWNIFFKLAKQNLIYPDGTYPKEVADYIKVEVDALMGKDEEE